MTRLFKSTDLIRRNKGDKCEMVFSEDGRCIAVKRDMLKPRGATITNRAVFDGLPPVREMEMQAAFDAGIIVGGGGMLCICAIIGVVAWMVA